MRPYKTIKDLEGDMRRKPHRCVHSGPDAGALVSRAWKLKRIKKNKRVDRLISKRKAQARR